MWSVLRSLLPVSEGESLPIQLHKCSRAIEINKPDYRPSRLPMSIRREMEHVYPHSWHWSAVILRGNVMTNPSWGAAFAKENKPGSRQLQLSFWRKRRPPFRSPFPPPFSWVPILIVTAQNMPLCEMAYWILRRTEHKKELSLHFIWCHFHRR